MILHEVSRRQELARKLKDLQRIGEEACNLLPRKESQVDKENKQMIVDCINGSRELVEKVIQQWKELLLN